MEFLFMLVGICLWLLPGSALTFFIGMVLQKNGWPSFRAILGATLVGGVVGAFLLGTWVSHDLGTPGVTDHFSKPLTVSEARKVFYQIPIPDAARNIKIGMAGEFHGYEYLVRFEAPVDVCKDELHAATASYSGGPWTWEPLTMRPSPEGTKYGNSMFSDAQWFDVQNIARGETATVGPDQFWVDEDRSVFYYKRAK